MYILKSKRVRVIFSLLILVLLLLISNKVKANYIENIKIDIFIDKFGNASVTEIWESNITRGTEGFKPYGNLGNMYISDLGVKDETGTSYTYVSNWDSSDSREYKKNKCGMKATPSGIEICWGVGTYGKRTYTLQYKINGFVEQFSDYQGIYFSLIPKEMDTQVNSVNISISSSNSFNEKNCKIWSFGYNGNINFESGRIVLNTSKKLNSGYMVALVKFETNMFTSKNNTNNTFQEIYDTAMKGTKKTIEDLILSYGTIIILSIYSIVIISNIFYMTKSRKESEYKFEEKSSKLPSIKMSDYYRDIPYNKDLYRAYWIMETYNIPFNKSGLIGGILLTWIKDGSVTILKTKEGKLNIKDNNYAIDLSKRTLGNNHLEGALLYMLKEASGSNGILEAKEFEKWCSRYYNQIENWFIRVSAFVEKQLIDEGMIIKTQKDSSSIFSKKSESIKTVKMVKKDMQKEALKILGFERFLLDYSLINQRQAIEVEVWEDYLIFGTLIGISNKVEEQFAKLYPEFETISRLNTNETTLVTRHIAYTGYCAAHNMYEQQRTNSSRGRSSGSGGKSYSGRGSGSSGSSSGGGFR